MALDRRNADGFGLALDEAETGAGAQVVVGDEYLHRGTAATHESIRAREGAEVHELDERVEGELLRGAGVQREVGTRGLVRVDETGAAAPRRRDAVEDRRDGGRGLGVEECGEPRHPVGLAVEGK